MRKLTHVCEYIFRITVSEIIGVAIDVVIMLVYSFIGKWDIFFALIMIIILVIQFFRGINNAKIFFEKNENTIWAEIIREYDISKNEIDKFSNIENRILKEHVCVGEKAIRNREIKMAYIIKAQIDADTSVIQTTSILSILITLSLNLIKEAPFANVIFFVLFVLIFTFLLILIEYLPREKYIANVCDKIIHECNK